MHAFPPCIVLGNAPPVVDGVHGWTGMHPLLTRGRRGGDVVDPGSGDPDLRIRGVQIIHVY